MYLGGLTPVVDRREFCRTLARPCVVAVKPILPHAVKTRISGGIKAEGMPPSFLLRGREDGVVEPLDDPSGP